MYRLNPHPKEITLRVYYVSILQMYRLNQDGEIADIMERLVSILQMYRLNRHFKNDY